MPFDPQKHHRRSIRLKDYDYSQPGAYFVTICAHDRELLFGNIHHDIMHLNRMGLAVRKTWLDLPYHYPHVILDAFVIMPNHMHGIIVLTEDGGGGSVPGDVSTLERIEAGQVPSANPLETRPYNIAEPFAPRHALPEIVRAFKTFSAQRVNALRRTSGIPVWQRNYYEHIIRDSTDLQNKTDYINANPLLWDEDDENPINKE